MESHDKEASDGEPNIDSLDLEDVKSIQAHLESVPLSDCSFNLLGRSENFIHVKKLREKAMTQKSLELLRENPYYEVWDLDYYSTSDEEDEGDDDDDGDTDDSEVDSEEEKKSPGKSDKVEDGNKDVEKEEEEIEGGIGMRGMTKAKKKNDDKQDVIELLI